MYRGLYQVKNTLFDLKASDSLDRTDIGTNEDDGDDVGGGGAGGGIMKKGLFVLSLRS